MVLKKEREKERERERKKERKRNKYEKNKYEVMMDHRSCARNFSSCEIKADFKPEPGIRN